MGVSSSDSAVTWKRMGVSSSELFHYLELNESLLVWTLSLPWTEWESPHLNSSITWNWMGVLFIWTLALPGTELEAPHLNSAVTWKWMGVSSSELFHYLDLNGSLLISLPGTEWESPHFVTWNWMGVSSFRYLEMNGSLLIWTLPLPGTEWESPHLNCQPPPPPLLALGLVF
jgi:hypothetical protein